MTPHQISRIARSLTKYDHATRNNFESAKNALYWNRLAAAQWKTGWKKLYHLDKSVELLDYIIKLIPSYIPQRQIYINLKHRAKNELTSCYSRL